ETEGGVIRQPLRAVSGEDRVGNAREHALDDPVAQLSLSRGLRGTALRGNAESDAQPDDARDVLGPRAPALLLPAAGLDRRQARASANEERSDTLGSIELVRVHRHEIHGELTNVEVERAHGLHRVRVKLDPAVMTQGAD